MALSFSIDTANPSQTYAEIGQQLDMLAGLLAQSGPEGLFLSDAAAAGMVDLLLAAARAHDQLEDLHRQATLIRCAA